MRDNGKFPAEPVSTVTETIYRRIRQEILDGAFKPAAKLKLDTLKGRYHVSVNTLRETLSRLVADGLVQNEGQRGFTVVPASLADLRDITEMRRMLECEAARRSLQRASLDWESTLVAAYHKLSKVEAVVDAEGEKYGGLLEQYNREFHAALIANCGSPWLIQLHGMMYDQSLRYRMLAFQVKDFPREQSRREHREILEAALARDAERLVAVLSAHVTKGADLYVEVEAKGRGGAARRKRR